MPRPRTDYRVELRPDGTLQTERDEALAVPEGWTPEHLLLAALTRCSLHSLAYHAQRASIDVTGSGTATGSIDRRPDGSWGFIDIDCEPEISVSPSPEGEGLIELLDSAERGCFVGASLEPRPRYRWRVNGVHVR